jgi:8-oxo-dGTP pyrophosphatase MutT (NUDIX family)
MNTVIQRQAIRAILLTPGPEVLLMRIHEPGRKDYFWWIAPGGGVEPGETVEETLRRELLEEVGLKAFDVGPLVWRRQHTFNWAGKRICQNEHYYVVHVSRFEPTMTDPAEAKVLDRFRWWTVAELANATEALTPLSLSQIVTRYLERGAPQEPPEVEVLVD